MCGLVGIAGDLHIKHKDAFKDMLLICQLRGRDATGIFAVNNQNNAQYVKQVGTPEILMDMKSFDNCLQGIPKVMAGHCRKKTLGENTRMNAHPYSFDHIVGMHNGTLRNHHKLSTYDHTRTDSHALYELIDKEGLEATFKDLDPAGAWALVWWDAEDNTLNFLRNEERPLWFAWTKDRRNILWASEPWWFGAAARIFELWDGKGEEGEEARSPYFQLPPNQHWKFSVNGFAKANEKPLTLSPIREIKAEGTSGNFHGYRGSNKTPTQYPNQGGSVPRPFQGGTQQSLDDDVNDIGQPLNRQNPAATQTAEGSIVTTSTPTSSKSPSSNVLDFRRGLMHSTNSARSTLSLPSKSSNDSPPKDNEKSSRNSATFIRPTNHLISLRTVAGISYISCKVTNQEWTEAEFEANTGGICSFCKAPIGDLPEVAEFTSKKSFICTTCHNPPNPVELRRALVM